MLRKKNRSMQSRTPAIFSEILDRAAPIRGPSSPACSLCAHDRSTIGAEFVEEDARSSKQSRSAYLRAAERRDPARGSRPRGVR
jgi:hypothetical protein